MEKVIITDGTKNLNQLFGYGMEHWRGDYNKESNCFYGNGNELQAGKYVATTKKPNNPQIRICSYEYNIPCCVYSLKTTWYLTKVS